MNIDDADRFLSCPELQDRITARLEKLDGRGRFREDAWTREGGGGAPARSSEDGAVFEKAGVNWSDVHGELAEDFARSSSPARGAASAPAASRSSSTRARR